MKGILWPLPFEPVSSPETPKEHLQQLPRASGWTSSLSLRSEIFKGIANERNGMPCQYTHFLVPPGLCTGSILNRGNSAAVLLNIRTRQWHSLKSNVHKSYFTRHESNPPGSINVRIRTRRWRTPCMAQAFLGARKNLLPAGRILITEAIL